MDNRKQGVSIRMSTKDVGNIKKISARLGVRDSDVIRYAVKSTLCRLMLLQSDDAWGKDVLPVFIEYGAELAQAFDLDVSKLNQVINGTLEDPERIIGRKDIELLTMSGSTDGYMRMRVMEAVQADSDQLDINSMLRNYLYRKYIGDMETCSE